MRIVLIYPPPWQIPQPGESPQKYKVRAPQGIDLSACLNGDILNIPQGLLSLAAQEKDRGNEVEVLNLFTFPWSNIEEIMTRFQADIYGLSVFTANRRGALALAELIKEIHPGSHVAAGGPHATALSEEILLNCTAIDIVVRGEGEQTFRELVHRCSRGTDLSHVPGTVFRKQGKIIQAPQRKRITNLDRLISPFRYYDDYLLLTSRGCAWNCSFCASRSIWGNKRYAHSPAYILDSLEQMVNKNRQKNIAIKDETFTADKTRVLDVCKGILDRKLNFLWSCDTRADSLDEEILFMMRKAGCQRISFGVESASQKILQNLNKKIEPDTVRKATCLARKFGFQLRYYMIVGSRGETMETLKESIDFLMSEKPSQVIFNPFTLFPGTPEFEVAQQDGTVDENLFFKNDFFELSPLLFETDNKETQCIKDWVVENAGLKTVSGYTLEERKKIYALFPKSHFVSLDLAEACYQEGNFEMAEKFVHEAADRNYPHKGILHNYFACLSFQKNDLKSALENLIKAKEEGYHQIVEENIAKVQSWIRSGGPGSNVKLALATGHDFEVTRPFKQPVTPGRLKLDRKEIKPVVF